MSKEPTPHSGENEVTPEWGYSEDIGPEYWAKLLPDSDCGGAFQSPINIIDIDAEVDLDVTDLKIHYAVQTQIHDVINNGHSIQYNFEFGDYIEFNGTTFHLKQIHFHESSEHTINGIRYPMAIHMVHKSKENETTVFAIMVQEGKSSPPFEFLENYLPFNSEESNTINAPFDLNQTLPEDKGYYTYKGSLTTPPCTEGVNWVVFKNLITISVEQIKILQGIMPLNNYRNEQPLNGRVVKKTL